MPTDGDRIRSEDGPIARTLATARDAVLDDRGDTHGAVEDNFGEIAVYWSEYLGVEVLPHDVAALMVLMKVSRQNAGRPGADHYADICGYAAIANGLWRIDDSVVDGGDGDA